MKTYSIFNIVFIIFSCLVCAGALKLKFGSFSDPGAGFMPFLCGLLLMCLSVVDLFTGILTRWKADRKDGEVWANIDWRRLLVTVVLLGLYVFLMPIIGFSLPTAVLLFFLFRLIEHRHWFRAALMAAGVTAVFYAGFGIALGAQLPKGFLGF
ncbi:MAG TPA: tripartite tricarboxylate transporter TctB family protein [Syntrophorhabdaceae bacterium]|nr:tripartite tricarboxylate transporter TctB family protein [Syntrophorhabdaceae bacterium]